MNENIAPYSNRAVVSIKSIFWPKYEDLKMNSAPHLKFTKEFFKKVFIRFHYVLDALR